MRLECGQGAAEGGRRFNILYVIFELRFFILFMVGR